MSIDIIADLLCSTNVTCYHNTAGRNTDARTRSMTPSNTVGATGILEAHPATIGCVRVHQKAANAQSRGAYFTMIITEGGCTPIQPPRTIMRMHYRPCAVRHSRTLVDVMLIDTSGETTIYNVITKSHACNSMAYNATSSFALNETAITCIKRALQRGIIA